MKSLLLILFTTFTSFSIEDPIDRLGVSGPLTFQKTAFNLAWTDKPQDNYYIQEYLPKGQTV